MELHDLLVSQGLYTLAVEVNWHSPSKDERQPLAERQGASSHPSWHRGYLTKENSGEVVGRVQSGGRAGGIARGKLLWETDRKRDSVCVSMLPMNCRRRALCAKHRLQDPVKVQYLS